MTRADRRTVRALFLLGCNDHLLPRVDQAGGILDRRDRAFLREHDLPLADATFDELDQELQNIYSTLTRPTELLHVSYPPSRWTARLCARRFVVERIRRLLPDVALVREDGEYRLTVPQRLWRPQDAPRTAPWPLISGQIPARSLCWRP